MSEKHQSLLNALAKALEREEGVRVTHIDTGGTPQLFSEKYRDLPKPPDIDGKVPDLLGTDRQGVIHLGEAETDLSGPYTKQTEEQMYVFGRRFMPETNTPVPLHVIVPSGDREAMKVIMRRIGLGDKIGRHIHIWEEKRP